MATYSVSTLTDLENQLLASAPGDVINIAGNPTWTLDKTLVVPKTCTAPGVTLIGPATIYPPASVQPGGTVNTISNYYTTRRHLFVEGDGSGVGGGGYVTLQNITFDGQSVAGGFNLGSRVSGGTLVMDNGAVFTNCTNKPGTGALNGAGLNGGTGGTYGGLFIMQSGSVGENSEAFNHGGFVWLNRYIWGSGDVGGTTDTDAIPLLGIPSVMILNGGTLENNSADGVGGSVDCSEGSKMIMNSGTIINNKSDWVGGTGGGGGINVDASSLSPDASDFPFTDPTTGTSYDFKNNLSQLVLNGGTITQNYTNGYGGGVSFAIPAPSRIDMNGGEISHNNADIAGGGIGVMPSTSGDNILNQSGGEIINNSAPKGGGVYIV